MRRGEVSDQHCPARAHALAGARPDPLDRRLGYGGGALRSSGVTVVEALFTDALPWLAGAPSAMTVVTRVVSAPQYM